MKPTPPAVASPCINICQMHAASGWCVGCLRTLDEIASWGGLSDEARRGVLRHLAPRRVAWRAMRADAQGLGTVGNATGKATGDAAGNGGRP